MSAVGGHFLAGVCRTSQEAVDAHRSEVSLAAAGPKQGTPMSVLSASDASGALTSTEEEDADEEDEEDEDDVAEASPMRAHRAHRVHTSMNEDVRNQSTVGLEEIGHHSDRYGSKQADVSTVLGKHHTTL